MGVALEPKKPAPFEVGMGMKNWKKNEYAAGTLKMGMSMGMGSGIRKSFNFR